MQIIIMSVLFWFDAVSAADCREKRGVVQKNGWEIIGGALTIENAVCWLFFRFRLAGFGVHPATRIVFKPLFGVVVIGVGSRNQNQFARRF